VHVVDGLASVRAGVEDNPVALFCDALGDCHVVGVRNEIRQEPVISGREVRQIGVVVTRDHQDMNGGLRINVAKSDRARIARNYGGGYLSGRNAAEQAVRHGEDLNVYRAGDADHIYGCSTANPRCTAPLVQRPRQDLAFRRSGIESCAGADEGTDGRGGMDVARQAGLPVELRPYIAKTLNDSK
jgi:hypothetical protein